MLYARLRSLSGATSDEELARELNVKLRTLARLKAGEGTQYETTIRLLTAAGWLSLDGDSDARARLRETQRFLVRGISALELIRQAAEGVSETPESDHRPS